MCCCQNVPRHRRRGPGEASDNTNPCLDWMTGPWFHLAGLSGDMCINKRVVPLADLAVQSEPDAYVKLSGLGGQVFSSVVRSWRQVVHKVPAELQNNSAFEEMLHLKRQRTRRARAMESFIVFNRN